MAYFDSTIRAWLGDTKADLLEALIASSPSPSAANARMTGAVAATVAAVAMDIVADHREHDWEYRAARNGIRCVTCSVWLLGPATEEPWQPPTEEIT
jgi:hypothetical protein